MIALFLCTVIYAAGVCDADTATAGPRRVITNDSAAFIAPKALAPLAGAQTTVTLRPHCPIDSALLFVRRYNALDTLGRFIRPPCHATWRFDTVPDQDQLHLQFGYTLYHASGDTIQSAPLPHRWVIDRRKALSQKRYRCREIDSSGQIVVDGALDEWTRAKPREIPGAQAHFRCLWTPEDFFFAIVVNDREVTAADHVEIMFDMLLSRESFAGIEHRIVSMGPMRRRYTWAPLLRDSGPVQSDSILVRFDDEMEWRGRVTPTGYIIECRIPFVILAAIEFPPGQFGFDVAVIDPSRHDRQSAASWSETPPAARHNPSEWATVVLTQRMPGLKALLSAVSLAATLLILGVLGLIARQKHQEFRQRQADMRAWSAVTRRALSMLDDAAAPHRLSAASLAAASGVSIDEMLHSVRTDTGAPLSRHIVLAQIRKARSLLRDPETDPARVYEACGFADHKTFCRRFAEIAGSTPERYREHKMEELREELEEETEADRHENPPEGAGANDRA